MKIDKSFAEKVYYLSQYEGLTDNEIAKKLDCSKSTVTRTKKKFNIPIRNLSNRKDKTFVCVYCRDICYVRRNEEVRLMCDSCREQQYKND